MSKEQAAWVVPEDVWTAWVQALARQRAVYAPVHNGPALVFARLHDGADIDWQRAPTTLSARSVFLPQRETLFRYERQSGQLQLQVPPPAEAAVLVGARPCDVQALRVMDHLLAMQDRQDPYYAGRRRQTLLVGLACDEPHNACFCTAVGGDPARSTGCDLFLQRLDGAFLVQALTLAGRELIDGQDWQPADEVARARAQAQATAVRAALPAPRPALQMAELSRAVLEKPLWGVLANRCLGCGACAFSCPTCHCFDIIDEPQCATCGQRLRFWDSCQFPVYTLEASGHNPRPSRRERLRQRVLDKLAYLPQQTEGMLGCVGCGRCVRNCPVGMDLQDILREVKSWDEIDRRGG
jgi:sulfhydrogenase subunit beta (sulfur reductase)